MQDEVNSLQKNKTYELVEFPERRKSLKKNRMFELKRDGKKLVNDKACLVAKEFG